MKYAAALALCLVASPAFADAVTYYGHIGDASVVVEFSEDPVGAGDDLFGRYFYTQQGTDIPLHAIAAGRADFGMVEEVPCSEEKNNCPHPRDEPPSAPPLGAKWALDILNGGEQLKGKFSSGGRDRAISLLRTGTRPFDTAGGLQALTEFATGLWWQGTKLTPEASPYDYLKMANFPFDHGSWITFNGNKYFYATDSRTKFRFPRIANLAGDSDTVPANDFLDQRHWMMSLDALYCVSQQYQGFGWNGYNYDAGTLGWWDEEQVDVHYLSRTIMTWTESGSLSCGGAHPYNHYEYYNLDLAAGRPLDMSRIFKGWVAKDYDGNVVGLEEARANASEYQWGPDEELLAFVNEHRPTNEELGFPGDDPDGCPIDELVSEYLSISFMGDDIVHFGMDGVPHVAAACASDLYDAPITELRELLTPEAAGYFPVLDD